MEEGGEIVLIIIFVYTKIFSVMGIIIVLKGNLLLHIYLQFCEGISK